MSEEKRTIKINTALFKIPDTRKNRKPKEQKEIKVKTPKKETNKTLKRSLLRFLRNHQERNLTQLNSSNKNEIDKPKANTTADFNSDFNESLEYLTKLAKENEKSSNINPHNKTLKHYPDYGKPSMIEPIINTTLPIELLHNDFTNKITEKIQPSQPVSINYKHYPPPPSYGCLKNGSLPTFRMWKNQTQKNFNTNSSTLNYKPILSNPTEHNSKPMINTSSISTNNLSNINPIQNPNKTNNMIEKSIITQNINKMTNINNQKNKKFVKKQKKTLKRTYNVGKSKMYPKISVLVSNKTIRNNITTKSQLLKQIPIQEVKKYLIKKGFIRVGSIAPNDVLRKMYETSILMCGEIQNHNPDNLLYNYLHNSEE